MTIKMLNEDFYNIFFDFYPHCHFVQRGSTICFVVLLVLVLLLGESLIRSNQKALQLGSLHSSLGHQT
jgi:uncharacterized membrane protein